MPYCVSLVQSGVSGEGNVVPLLMSARAAYSPPGERLRRVTDLRPAQPEREDGETEERTTVTRGPLVLGPLFAFAIALSKISFLGLGPFFWSLVIGMLVSLLLERKPLEALRAGAPGGRASNRT